MDNLLINLKAVLRSTPPRWTVLAHTVPEDLLRRQPLPHEWSTLECLQHLIDLDRILFPVRIKAMFAGEPFPPFDVRTQGPVIAPGAAPADLAAEFEALRTETLALVDTLTEDDFERPGFHPALGSVTLANLLHQWAAHDLMHLVQAQQALMQPFIQGTGPWHIYFSAHTATPVQH